MWSWLGSRVPIAAAAGFALAAGLAGYAIRGEPRSVTATVAATPVAESQTALTSLPAALRPLPAQVPTQFILNAPGASRVALVGDFNSWDASATPLVRDSSSGIWTVTLPLVPGRHVYAFMVDGSTLTLDPRTPKTQDPEFGTPSSVVLVGTP
jgi:1,4-alpha-glucan branching enzyme